jgi:hypothetical protein
MKRVEIELPFSGFYNSIHGGEGSNIDRALEDGFNYNHEIGEDQEVPDIWGADIDYKAIEMEYCEAYTNAFGEQFDLDLEFVQMTSPKDYNYGTDRAFVTIPLSQINKIRRKVEKHKKWPQYIKDNFTSYDGFWSNYENDSTHEEWTRPELDECQYGVILKFWLNEIEETYENWREAELWLTQEFEMCNWDSIINAHEKIREYLKEENIKEIAEDVTEGISKAVDWIRDEFGAEHNMPSFAWESVQELQHAVKRLEEIR